MCPAEEGTAFSDDADQWFSNFLQFPCRLLRSVEGAGVFQDENILQRHEPTLTRKFLGDQEHGYQMERAPGDQRSFANEAPLLMVNNASVQALKELMEEASTSSSLTSEHSVDVLNFRPNLVIEGRPAHEESSWKGLTFSSLYGETVTKSQLKVDKPCARCVINVNPKTGKMEGRALSSLAAFGRSNRGGSPSNCFGLFLSVDTWLGNQKESDDEVEEEEASIMRTRVQMVQVLEQGSPIDVLLK